MNDKQVHFLGGLPRSCSSMLAGVLGQNPDFHATATSPLFSIVSAARDARTNLPFKALSKHELDERFPSVFKGIIEGWFASNMEDVCFDKSRAWLGELDLLDALYESPKVIIPIRDIRGIVASMEKLHRRNAGVIDGMLDASNNSHLTIQGRVDAYLNSTLLGGSMSRLMDAWQRGQLKECFVVRAEDLTSAPEMQMRKLHAFLGRKYFDYDFNNIKSSAWENDAVHEPYGEHTIQDSILPIVEDWDDILTPEVAASVKSRCAWFYEAFYPNAV